MKHLVKDVEFVSCPYCDKESQFLNPSHLRVHKKTLMDVRNEFPNHPTMTKTDYERRLIISKQGAKASKDSCKNMKIISCIHCNEKVEVPNNYSNKIACKDCISKGLNNPDGRTKDSANVNRKKTLKEKYGVENARNIDGVIDTTSKTNRKKYGGTGFASPELDKKSRDTMEKIHGYRNPMKSEYGLERFKGHFKKKYGKNITNPLHVLEIAKKVSETLQGHLSPLKGKTYEEIHGPEKAKILKEQKRISGAKSCLKQPPTSKPQLELFKMVKEILPNAKLEYESHSYILDIAIPELKLCIEYDGSYWHKPEHDKQRDELLENFGWKTIRFVDRVPTMGELKEKIKEVLSR